MVMVVNGCSLSRPSVVVPLVVNGCLFALSLQVQQSLFQSRLLETFGLKFEGGDLRLKLLGEDTSISGRKAGWCVLDQAGKP